MKRFLGTFYIILIILYSFIPFGSATYEKLILDSIDQNPNSVSPTIKNSIISIIGKDLYNAKSIGSIKDGILESLDKIKNTEVRERIIKVLDLEFDFDFKTLQSRLKSLLNHPKVIESFNHNGELLKKTNLRGLQEIKYNITHPQWTYIMMFVMGTFFWGLMVFLHYHLARRPLGVDIVPVCLKAINVMAVFGGLGLGFMLAGVLANATDIDDNKLLPFAFLGMLPNLYITCCVREERLEENNSGIQLSRITSRRRTDRRGNVEIDDETVDISFDEREGKVEN